MKKKVYVRESYSLWHLALQTKAKKRVVTLCGREFDPKEITQAISFGGVCVACRTAHVGAK